jgi:hypothetical protein
LREPIEMTRVPIFESSRITTCTPFAQSGDAVGFARHESHFVIIVVKESALRQIFDANRAHHSTQRDAVCYPLVIGASRRMTMVPEKREGMESPVNIEL